MSLNVSVFLDQEMSVSHFMERGCKHFWAPFIDKASDPSACTDINSLIFKTAATRIRYVCCITLLKSIVQTKKSNQGRQFTNQDICFIQLTHRPYQLPEFDGIPVLKIVILKK